MNSRSPLDFLRRKGLSAEPARPRPRFDVDALLVHSVPLASPPKPTQAVLEGLEGETPPDRGLTHGWPGQGEHDP